MLAFTDSVSMKTVCHSSSDLAPAFFTTDPAAGVSHAFPWVPIEVSTSLPENLYHAPQGQKPSLYLSPGLIQVFTHSKPLTNVGY